MIEIYDYSHKLEGMYFLKEGPAVVLVDLQKRTIQASSIWLRLQSILLSYTTKKLWPGTETYNRVLDKYEALLADLVLPYRYDIRMMNEDEIKTFEKRRGN